MSIVNQAINLIIKVDCVLGLQKIKSISRLLPIIFYLTPVFFCLLIIIIMGNFYSSISEDAKTFNELSKEGQTPGGGSQVTVTPTTPENNAFNPKIAGLVDPRSPSQGVSRTPLEIEERNKRIERTRLKNQFNKENNLLVPQVPSDDAEDDLVTTPTGPQSKEFPPGFDPRSPNPEISRTPIALNQNIPVKGRKMFNSQENME